MEQDKDQKTLQDDWKQFEQFFAVIESLPQTAYRKIRSYLEFVEKVKEDRKLSDDDKLKLLLTPLYLWHKISPFNEPIPFVSDSINIDLELDCENLHYDEERYYIDLPPSMVLSPMLKNISVKGKNEIAPGLTSRTSLEELHKEWLPTLTQETMKNTDLLDQLLVLHTIKLALNHDKQAIKKLYNLYEKSAVGLARNVAEKFFLEMEDVEQTVKLNLEYLISGYHPEYILKQLLSDRSSENLPKLPKWIKDFYLYYFLEYLPTEIRKNLKENGMLDQEKIRRRRDEAIQTLKDRGIFLGMEWLGIFNLYPSITAGTLWKNTSNRIKRFNSYCFRPGRQPNGRIIKMGRKYNLTTWLLGGKEKSIYSGMLYRRLADHYKLRERLFQMKDFTDLPSLISKLRNGKDPVSRYIVSKFSPGLRRILKDFNEGEPSKVLLRSVKNELNQLLRTPCLFSKDRFGEIDLSQGTQELLERNPHGVDLIRLNRLLLEDAYPREIKPRLKVRKMSEDFSGGDENHDGSLPSKDDSPEENTRNVDFMEKMRDALLEAIGPARHAQRDVDIFCRYRLNEIPQSKIAKEQGLSTGHIKKICRKVKNSAINSHQVRSLLDR